jgi:chorismate mutase / prephenate dehydratase
MKIAFFGHPGSYTHLAALEYIKKLEIDNPMLLPCETPKEVVAYVDSGHYLGILPIHNSTAGDVSDHVSVLGSDYKEISKIKLPIHHFLLKRADVDENKITFLYSHSQAFSQCKKAISEMEGIEIREYKSTSTAARDLSIGKIPKQSWVIASKLSANIYDLQIIQKNIEDEKSNKTTFIVFEKKQ